MSKYKNIKQAILALLNKSLPYAHKKGLHKLSPVKVEIEGYKKPLKLSLRLANGYSDNSGLDTSMRRGMVQIMLIGEFPGEVEGALIPNAATRIARMAGLSLDENIWGAASVENGEEIYKNPNSGNISVHSDINKKTKKSLHKFSIFINEADIDMLKISANEQAHYRKSYGILDTKSRLKRAIVAKRGSKALTSPVGGLINDNWYNEGVKRDG